MQLVLCLANCPIFPKTYATALALLSFFQDIDLRPWLPLQWPYYNCLETGLIMEFFFNIVIHY